MGTVLVLEAWKLVASVDNKEWKSTHIEHPVGVKLCPYIPSPHPDNYANNKVYYSCFLFCVFNHPPGYFSH